MRFMKKFGALALATVAVAASVWYVTPALQALASSERFIWDSTYCQYTEDENGTYVWDGEKYTEWDEKQDDTGKTETNTPKTPVKYTIRNQEKGIGIFTNAFGSIYVEPENIKYDLVDKYDYGTITYKSQDESIAVIDHLNTGSWYGSRVDFSAIIKGVKAGTTKITVTATYSGKTETLGNIEVRVYDRTSKTVVDASPASSSSSSSSAAVPAPVKVVAPDGQALLQYTAIGAKNTLMAAPEGIVPQGAILAQYEVKEDSQTYEVAKTILGLRVPNATLAKVLDFNLSAKTGTLIHQLDGRVAISFDIPANFTVPAGYVPRVYRFNDNGTVTACETILDKGKVVFGTDHFSTFALVLEKAPKAK